MKNHIRFSWWFSAVFLSALLVAAGPATGEEPRKSAASQGMVAEAYNLRGLVVAGDTGTWRELCTSLVAPDSWEDVGGEASISLSRTKMAVRQTPAVHKNIAALAEALRKLPKVNSKAARAVPREPRLLVGTQKIGNTEMQIAVYPIGNLLGPRVDFDSIIMHVTKTVEPTSWDEVGGQASIMVYPYRAALVVSNTPEAHKKITRLLAKLRPAGKRARGKR